MFRSRLTLLYFDYLYDYYQFIISRQREDNELTLEFIKYKRTFLVFLKKAYCQYLHCYMSPVYHYIVMDIVKTIL